MRVLVHYSPRSMTVEQYDEVARLIAGIAEGLPEGLEYHVCFGSHGQPRIAEVWRSREQLEAFGQWLRPLLARVGIDAGDPEVFEIHSILAP